MHSPALAYLENNIERHLTEIQELISIPSVSSDPARKEDMQRAVDWIARRLQRAGMEQVEIHPTAGHPIIYAKACHHGASRPTLLIYGHYDVQSPEPLADWKTAPFEPCIAGDNLVGRGATDMKGALMACLAAAEAVGQCGESPLNLKFLLEGEEELGSVNLAAFIQSHCSQLACDHMLSLDVGELPSRDTPVIACSLRGGAAFKLTIHGPHEDLHSGIFGGLVHNPIHALSGIIAALQEADGRITLPGFYDSVRELEGWERDELAGTQKGEPAFLEQTGAPALWGEFGYIPEERVGARPSMDVIGFQGGVGKSAIPSQASATFFFRLVADQDPGEVHQQFRQFLTTHTPRTVTWSLDYLAGYPAVRVPRHSPGILAMEKAYLEVFRKKPKFVLGGGSIPAVLMLQNGLKVDSVLTGFSLPDDHMHGPNEKLDIPTWKRGTTALVVFFQHLVAEA